MLRNIKEFNLNEEARFKHVIELMINETRVSRIFLQKITRVDISRLLIEKSKWAQYFVTNISELKMSEKQFMNDTKAITIFSHISILYLLISEEIKLKKDQNFLTSAYKSIFKLRKIDMFKKRNEKNIILLEGAFELSQFKDFLKDNQLEDGCTFLEQKILKYELLKQNNKELIIILNHFYSVELRLHDLLGRKLHSKLIRLIRLKDLIICQYPHLLDDPNDISQERSLILELSIRFLKDALYQTQSSTVNKNKSQHDIGFTKQTIEKHLQIEPIKNDLIKQEFTKIMEEYSKVKKDNLINEIIEDIETITEIQPSNNIKRISTTIDENTFILHHSTNKRKLIRNNLKENEIKFIAFSPVHHLKKPFSYERIKEDTNKKRITVIDNRSLLEQLEEIKQKKLYEMDKNIVIPDNTHNNINIHTKSVKKIKQVAKKELKQQKRLSFIKESIDEDIKLLELIKFKCLVENSNYVEMSFFHVLKKNIYEIYVNVAKPNKRYQILFDKIEKNQEQQFLSTLAFKFKAEMEKSPLFYEFFSNIKNSDSEQMIQHSKKILQSRHINLSSRKINNFQYIRSHLQKYIYWSYRQTRKINGSIYQRIKINENITDTLKFASYLKNFKENIVDGEIIVKNNDIVKNKNKKILIEIFKFLHTGKQIIFNEIIKRDLLNYHIKTLIIHEDTFKDIGAVNQSLWFKNIKLFNQYFQFKGLVNSKEKELIKFPEEQFLSSIMIENLMEENIKRYKRKKLINILGCFEKFEYESRLSSFNLMQEDYKIEIKEFVMDSKQDTIDNHKFTNEHQFYSNRTKELSSLITQCSIPRPQKCFQITKWINQYSYIVKITINYLQEIIKFQCIRHHRKLNLTISFDSLQNNNKLQQFQNDIYQIYDGLVVLKSNLYNILGLQLNTIYLTPTMRKLDTYIICKQKNQEHIKHTRLILKKTIKRNNDGCCLDCNNNTNSCISNNNHNKYLILLVERNYFFNFWQISIYDMGNSQQSVVIINVNEFFNLKINFIQFQRFLESISLSKFSLKELYEITLKIDTAEVTIAFNQNSLDFKIKKTYLEKCQAIQKKYWEELTINLSVNQNIIKIRKQIFESTYFILTHCIYQPKLNLYKTITMFKNINKEIIILIMDHYDPTKLEIIIIPIFKAEYHYKSEIVTFNRQRKLKIKLKDICYFFIEKIKEDLLSNYKCYIVSSENVTLSKSQLELANNQLQCQQYCISKQKINLHVQKLKLRSHFIIKITNTTSSISFQKNFDPKDTIKQFQLYQRFIKHHKYFSQITNINQ